MASNNTLQQRLDAYVAGECSSGALTEELLAHCAAVPRASWEVLALLDQYQRRGKLPRDLQRNISQSIQRRALGVYSSELSSVGRQIGAAPLEAANQPSIKVKNAALKILPKPTASRLDRVWQWPARSAQLISLVAFMLAVGASQGLGEHENALALHTGRDRVRVAVPGRVMLAADTFIVRPDGQSALITVTRAEGTDGAVSFRWWTQSAGAKAGADYRGHAAARVSMPPGTGALQLTVPILKNPARRHTELFYVAIGDPDGGATLGDTRRAAVFIMPR